MKKLPEKNADCHSLVNEALKGNQQALERLVSQSNDFIFNLSLRMLGSIVDAEDATQEILIKIVTNLSSFKRKSTFNTWVYRIAINHLIDYKKIYFQLFLLILIFMNRISNQRYPIIIKHRILI